MLDQVDGVVFVLDTQRERLDANLASLAELRTLLGEYGRELSDVPMVVQYNKRDLSDEFALEELHRKLDDLTSLAAFEAVATQGTGVLQSLTTISKLVVRHLRENPAVAELAAPSADEALDLLGGNAPSSDEALDLLGGDEPSADEALDLLGGDESSADEALDLLGGDESFTDPVPTEGLSPELLLPDEDSDVMETAALTEAAFEESFQAVTDPASTLGVSVEAPGRLEIVQVGTARQIGATSVAVPLVLRDENGAERSLQLSVSLDALDVGPTDDSEG